MFLYRLGCFTQSAQKKRRKEREEEKTSKAQTSKLKDQNPKSAIRNPK
jgi:hypothetical protein